MRRWSRTSWRCAWRRIASTTTATSTTCRSAIRTRKSPPRSRRAHSRPIASTSAATPTAALASPRCGSRPIISRSTATHLYQQINQDGFKEVELDLPGKYQQTRVKVGTMGLDDEYVDMDLSISNVVLQLRPELGQLPELDFVHRQRGGERRGAVVLRPAVRRRRRVQQERQGSVRQRVPLHLGLRRSGAVPGRHVLRGPRRRLRHLDPLERRAAAAGGRILHAGRDPQHPAAGRRVRRGVRTTRSSR